MQNIEMYVIYTAPLGGVKSTTTNDEIVYGHLRDAIHVSARRYVQQFRYLAVPTSPLQMKHFIL